MGLLDWLSVGTLLAGAVVAIAGARRVRDLNLRAREPRLGRLGGFFGALAAALALEAIGAGVFLLQGPAALREGFDVHDLFYWGRHLAWFVALGLGYAAFQRSRLGVRRHNHDAPAMAAVLLVTHPVLLAIEALVLLALVLRTAWNHLQRNNVGSLEVALGFAALSASRFLPFLLDPGGPVPLGPPHLATALFAAIGVWSLFLVIPRDRGGGVRG